MSVLLRYELACDYFARSAAYWHGEQAYWVERKNYPPAVICQRLAKDAASQAMSKRLSFIKQLSKGELT